MAVRGLGRCGVGPGRCPNEGVVRFDPDAAPICALHLLAYLVPFPARIDLHRAILAGDPET